MAAQAYSLRSIFYALGANFAIAIAKSTGAVFTGSASMLAEAIHSFADCGNQALLIWDHGVLMREKVQNHCQTRVSCWTMAAWCCKWTF